MSHQTFQMQKKDKSRPSGDHSLQSHYALQRIQTWTTNLSAHRSTMSTWKYEAEVRKTRWLKMWSYNAVKSVVKGGPIAPTCTWAIFRLKKGVGEGGIAYTFHKHDIWLTSSIGSSSSSGKQGASTPMTNGVGEQLTSSMLAGSTGMKVCCQVKG